MPVGASDFNRFEMRLSEVKSWLPVAHGRRPPAGHGSFNFKSSTVRTTSDWQRPEAADRRSVPPPVTVAPGRADNLKLEQTVARGPAAAGRVEEPEGTPSHCHSGQSRYRDQAQAASRL